MFDKDRLSPGGSNRSVEFVSEALNVEFLLLLLCLQIRVASKLNAKTILDIDNAKLAADDFKMK